MTRRTIPLTVPGVTEAEVAVGARVVRVEDYQEPLGLREVFRDGRRWLEEQWTTRHALAIEEPEPQGQTERRRWRVGTDLPTGVRADLRRVGKVSLGNGALDVWEQRP